MCLTVTIVIGTLSCVRRAVIVCVLTAFIGAVSVETAGLRNTEYRLSSTNSVSTPGLRAAHSEPAAPGSATPPVIAVIGASIACGTGAPSAQEAWPALLAKQIGWRSVVTAEPGAGYIALGAHQGGPMSKLLAGADLAHLQPAMVIVEAGFNDIGWPGPLLTFAVQDVIHQIQAQSPSSKVGVMTVFPLGDQPRPEAWATDAAIVSAAELADPQVYVFDPLATHWTFPRLPDGLHPNPVGHQWIADHMASELRRDGIVH